MNRLESGKKLGPGDELTDRNDWVRLVLQSDGDLALYRTQVARRLWHSDTAGESVTRVVMEAGGNLVAETAQGATRWESGTDGNPGATAVLQDDGDFVIRDELGNPIWRTATVQAFHTPTIEVREGKYTYVETSESLKELARQLPCFTALQWPGYSTLVIDDVYDGEQVVIQLWKGWCPQVLGLNAFPGGVGAEVGVYRRMRGALRLRDVPLLPRAVSRCAGSWVAEFTDREFWWPFPELAAELEYRLINPITGETFFSAGPETSYWLAKWMTQLDYLRYAARRVGRVPLRPDGYVLEYSINGREARWPEE